MSHLRVDIGILEEKESWLLHPRFFPSKIGGKPAWLDLKNLPSNSDLVCKKCNEHLVFLGQIYAPFEEIDEAFHRTIFIFICRNGPCCKPNSSDNFKVLRCQLPRKNNYYAFEPYEETKDEIFPMDNWPKLCELCGLKAPSHCSKCKKVYYCSRKHQVLDWKNGHKELCPTDKIKDFNFTMTPAGKSVLFKQWELVVDEEDEEDVNTVDANEEMEKFKKMIQEKKVGTLDDVSDNELEQYTNSTVPEDKVFKKFNKRVSRHPNQVLRYDRGGSPLWITRISQDSIQIPNCPYCNKDRQFEFQVMPQLLNFIDVGVEVNSIDWGILAIYTCKASCSNGPSYKEEFIVKQDIS